MNLKNEMIIPIANINTYKEIYAVENWFRRICYTLHVMEFGDSWEKHIPKKIKEKLDNLIGTDKSLLIRIIDNISEIRNFLAHNRAFSEISEIIIDGRIAECEYIIDNFKSRMLYSKNEYIDYSDDILSINFNRLKEVLGKQSKQIFLAADDDFYYFIRLPQYPFDNFLNIKKLLTEISNFKSNILSVLVNLAGDEYQIVIPKRNVFTSMMDISEILLNDNFWIEKSYTDQSSKYTCNPQIWFYKNKRDDG